MSGYIGTQPVPQSTQVRETFTATASQTSFATAGYTPGYIDVYLNGVKLLNGTDFTASNGSDVVLTTGAAASDTVETIAFVASDTVTVGGGYYKGERGAVGAATGSGDIFRINEQELNTDVTIDADENASATGPLAVATGVTLTVTTGGNLSIV